MTVYIEYVLIDNFVIDYLLIKSTLLILRLSVKRTRVVISAVIGSVVSLAFPLINSSWILVTAIKIHLGVLMLIIASNFKNAKSFFVTLLVFFALTFAVGGGIIGLLNIFGVKNYSEVLISIIFLPAYLIIKGLVFSINFIYKRKTVANCIFDCEITLFSTPVKAKGFLDTGNGLYYNNIPVIVCEKKFALKLINGFGKIKMQKMQVQTVAGTEYLSVIKIKEIKIYNGQAQNINSNVMLAVSKSSVGFGYNVILHPELFDKVKNEENYPKIKSAS